MGHFTIDFRGYEILHAGRREFWELVEAGGWEQTTFNAIDRFFNPDKIFFDVGAWNGIFSIYASLKGMKSVSVEPDKVAATELNVNFKINGIAPTLCRAAISKSDGFALLNSMGSSFGHSESSLINRGLIELEVTVPTFTIESLVNQYSDSPNNIALIKIDVEGGEVDIITSSKDWLAEHKPNIHISLHPAWIKQEGIDAIADVIFPIYTVETDDGILCQKETFNELINQHHHAFILTAQ